MKYRFDINNIFTNFVQRGYWYEHCYSIYQVSCQKLIYYNCYECLKYFIEIQRPPFLKMTAVPANFNFQIGLIVENVFHDLYCNYANVHALTTF